MKKQQIIIFLLVGIMFFSVIASGIVLLIDDGGTNEVAQEIEQIESQQCSPLAQVSGAQPIDPPEEPFIPDGDVTELQTVDLKVGDGQTIEPGDCITVHYHGTLAEDGTVFDSSYERGQPIRFSLNGVIEGWQEGVPGMKVGGVRRLVIPSDMGYGPAGSPPNIGPNADLVFIVEVTDVQ